MTATFDPGDGWRRVQSTAINGISEQVVHYGSDGAPLEAWVREELVPPLPIEEDTLIRATWKSTGAKCRFALDRYGVWQPVGLTVPYRSEVLRERITGFEVLARPAGDYAYDRVTAMEQVRRDTAKAVLDRVLLARVGSYPSDSVIEIIGREFGVHDV